jgi:hypothetical protein
MKVVKTIHLYINSLNRQEGTNWNFAIDIPPEIDIETKNDNQFIQLSLLKLSTYLEFYNITAGATDTVIFSKYNAQGVLTDSVTVVIPEGNYTYAKLAQLLTNSMCIVTYVSRLNKFSFNFGSFSGGLTFVNNSHRAFGFSSPSLIMSTLEGTSNMIYSNSALKPRLFDRLNISLFDVTPAANNYINDSIRTDENDSQLHGKFFQRTRLFASIAINNPPFTLLEYEEGAVDRVTMLLADKRLKRSRFVITNEYEELMTVLKDTFMIIRAEILEPDDTIDEQISTLKQINEWLKLGFVSSHLTDS